MVTRATLFIWKFMFYSVSLFQNISCLMINGPFNAPGISCEISRESMNLFHAISLNNGISCKFPTQESMEGTMNLQYFEWQVYILNLSWRLYLHLALLQFRSLLKTMTMPSVQLFLCHFPVNQSAVIEDCQQSPLLMLQLLKYKRDHEMILTVTLLSILKIFSKYFFNTTFKLMSWIP